MIYGIYPTKDSTIYEATSSADLVAANPSIQNTGLDAILDISKQFDTNDVPYNSRILLKFDLATVSASIAANTITNPKFYLNLYVSEAKEIPVDYTLECFAVSQSWNMGSGRFTNKPQTTDGVSWKYRLNATDTGSAWLTSSYAANSTGSFQSTPGGGNWYTNYRATESFEYVAGDLRTDVTDIVNAWLSGSIANDGFLLKKLDADEASTDVFESIKFFSRDSNTIYVPRLEVLWDDSSFQTGSLTELSSIWNSTIYLKNNLGEYNTNSRVRFRVGARDRYPARVFATSSAYLTSNYLPTSSYYAVKGLDNEDYVIPFEDEYTKISCDSEGNYIDLWMDGLQPERYYRLLIKVVTDEGTAVIDNKKDFIFKVVR